MSGSFKNPTRIAEQVSAYDYIKSKKSLHLFCDINNANSKVHKVKDGKLSQTIDHATLLAMNKGYLNYYQTVDVSNAFFSFFPDQITKNNHCARYPPDNTDISGGYFGSMLTTYEDGYQSIIDNKAFFQNEYSEISGKNITITDQHKVGKVRCIKLHNTNIKKT